MLLAAAALLFSPTYLTTWSPDFGLEMIADSQGNAYIGSVDLAQNSYLTKIGPTGRKIFHTELPSGQSIINAIAVDSSGNAYVESSVSVYGEYAKEFVTGLDSKGHVQFSYSVPVSNVAAIAAGPNGYLYLAGSAGNSPAGGQFTSYVAAIDTRKGGAVVFLKAVGGYGNTGISSIHVDSEGSIYVSGGTSDPDFPATPGAFLSQCCTAANPNASFVLKLKADGSAPLYSTLLPYGGVVKILSVDSAGEAKIMAVTADAAVPSAGVTTFLIDAKGSSISDVVSTTLHGAAIDPLGVTAGSGGSIIASVTGNNLPVSTGGYAGALYGVMVVHPSDGALQYASTVPGVSPGVISVADDGQGGFFFLGSTGIFNSHRPLTTVIHFLPVTEVRPAIVAVSNPASNSISPGIAAGEIVQISGINLGPDKTHHSYYDSNGRLPFSIQGTEVLFNGVAAPLLSVGKDQITVVAPFALAEAHSVHIRVRVKDQESGTASFPRLDAEPQIWPAIVNEDGSVSSPENPTKPGSVVSVFVNGAGLMNPTPEDGVRGARDVKTVLPVSAQIGDCAYDPVFSPTETLYAGQAPGQLTGKVQVNLRIPKDNPGCRIQITVGNQTAWH